MPMSSITRCCVSIQSRCSSSPTRRCSRISRVPGSPSSWAEHDAAPVALDGVLLERAVEVELLGHRLADADAAQPLQVGHALEHEDALDELLGVVHLLDGLVAVLVGQALPSPVLAQLGVGEVLVDGGEFGRQGLVEELDDARRTLHAADTNRPSGRGSALGRRGSRRIRVGRDADDDLRPAGLVEQPLDRVTAAAAASAGAALRGDVVDGDVGVGGELLDQLVADGPAVADDHQLRPA